VTAQSTSAGAMSLCVQQQASSDRNRPQGQGDFAVLNNKNTGVFFSNSAGTLIP